jgi:hypothetical protein
MGNFIYYTVLAIIMAICTIINGVLGNWFAFTFTLVVFIFDASNAAISFQVWNKNSKNKEKRGSRL